MSGNIQRIREAAAFIPADDRDTWLRIGMGIKSELGDTGFDLWNEWSQQADSYNTHDARDVWKSIRAGGKVTIGTLFHEAKANGWRDDGISRERTLEELAEERRVAEVRAAQEEAEVACQRATTATKALAIWKAATEAKGDHSYLLRKHVSPTATLREIEADEAATILGYPPKSSGEQLAGRLLVVPVKQGDRLSTLELIDGDGRKAALPGHGTKAGGYWASEPLPDGDGDGLTLLIGEGVATVLSSKKASGHLAIAALSAGNLPAVAKAMRERHPEAVIVILADLVKATGAPDPHAIEAARFVGGKLAIPDFGADRPRKARPTSMIWRNSAGPRPLSAPWQAQEHQQGHPAKLAQRMRQRATVAATTGQNHNRWPSRWKQNPIRLMRYPTQSGPPWKRWQVSSRPPCRWWHLRHWRHCRWQPKLMRMRSDSKSCMDLSGCSC